MAANSAAQVVTVLTVALCVACAGAADISDQESDVVNHVKRALARSVVELGEKIEECDSREQQSEIPNVSLGELDAKGVNRGSAIAAITYLAIRNRFNCEHVARLSVSWQLEKLAIISEEYGVETPSVEGVDRALTYPFPREIELEAKFANLPDAARAYLNNALGQTPFDPVKVTNKLLNSDQAHR